MSKSELEKWSDVHESIVEFEEFLGWLQSEKHIYLCDQQQDVEWPWIPHYYPLPDKIRDYWMEFNDIDPQKLEDERRVLLEKAREDAVRGTQE